MSRRKTIQDFLREDLTDITKLLCLALNQEREQLFAYPNYELNDKELDKLDKLVKDRNDGVPFAYLKGSQGFYELDFIVSPATLIPRPETELLIDISLNTFNLNKKIKALDLGTGSGAIAITLSKKCPLWEVTATDKSNEALKIAKLNTHKKINFFCGDWFDAVPDEKFDLIVSNPPYIDEHDPHLDNLKYEPLEALTSGADGLDDIRIIIKESPKYLKEGGYLLLEHGFNQQQEIIGLLKESFINVNTYKDLNDIDRAVLAQYR